MNTLLAAASRFAGALLVLSGCAVAGSSVTGCASASSGQGAQNAAVRAEPAPTDPRVRAAFVHERCGPSLPAGSKCGALHRALPDELELSALRATYCPVELSTEECRWNIALLLVLELVERYRYANFGLYATWCTGHPLVCFEVPELEQRMRQSHNKRLATLAEQAQPGAALPPPPSLEAHRRSILRLAQVMIDFVEFHPSATRWGPRRAAPLALNLPPNAD